MSDRLAAAGPPAAYLERPLAAWLRNAQAAAYLGLTGASLKTMRVRGRGPRYRKLGKIVLYARRDLDEWADRRSAVRETADSLPSGSRPRRRGAA